MEYGDKFNENVFIEDIIEESVEPIVPELTPQVVQSDASMVLWEQFAEEEKR